MAPRKSKLSLQDHIETANDFVIAFFHIERAYDRLQEHLPFSGNIMRWMKKLTPSCHGSLWLGIKAELDNHYHNLISDEQFKEHGHVYYGNAQRYKKLQEEGLIQISKFYAVYLSETQEDQKLFPVSDPLQGFRCWIKNKQDEFEKKFPQYVSYGNIIDNNKWAEFICG